MSNSTYNNSLDSRTKEAIDPFVQILRTESFAIANRLVDQSIAHIGELLEEAKERFENTNPNTTPTEFKEAKESFEKCNEAYCNLLLELDYHKLAWHPSESLNDLQHSQKSAPSFKPESTSMEPSSDWNLKSIVQNNYAKLISVPEARNFLNMAGFFDSSENNITTKIGTELCFRLRSQGLTFAVEVEYWAKFRPGLIYFWPQRQVALQGILANDRIDLKPELKEAMNTLARSHPNWLFQNRFPLSSVLASFRFYLKLEDKNKFRPSLLEMGALLFFFGNEFHLLEETPFTNYLGANSLNQTEITETTFRLSRLQKLKNKFLNPLETFQASDLAQVEEDCERLLRLLQILDFDAFPQEKTITHADAA